jgi:hypothetical protein
MLTLPLDSLRCWHECTTCIFIGVEQLGLNYIGGVLRFEGTLSGLVQVRLKEEASCYFQRPSTWMTLSLYPAHLGQRAYGHCR